MKIKRHSKIIELVKNHAIETQEELAERLKSVGFDVTQATVSRDIRELKLTKISGETGKLRYALLPSATPQLNNRLIRIFRDGVSAIDYAQNIIVIKTLEGMAMAVAACLDSLGDAQILGTIAGDDTLICIVKTEDHAIETINSLKSIIQDEHNK